MGYITLYIGGLELIAEGTISTNNLLDIIHVFYEQYNEQVNRKFLPYYETETFNSAKK